MLVRKRPNAPRSSRGRGMLRLAGLLAAAAALGPACNTFNGLSVPPEPHAGYLPLTLAARACTRMAECVRPNLTQDRFALDLEASLGIVTHASSFPYCMNALAGTRPADRPGFAQQKQALTCIANAADCDTARACLGVEGIAPGDPLCTGASSVCLTDGSAVTCNGEQRFVEHCTSPPYGGQGACDVDAGRFACSPAGEVPCAADQSTCDPATSILASCFAGNFREPIDCAAFGGTCDGTNCLSGGSYKPCPKNYRDQCDGDAIATCTVAGIESLTNCAKLGKRCTGDPPFCAGSGDECTPLSDPVGGCLDTQILLCIDGHQWIFDCASVEPGRTCGDHRCKSGR